MRALVVVAILLAVPTASAGASRTGATPCPKPAAAASLPVRPQGNVVRAVVERDGYSGRVTIRYAEGALSTCGFFLVVETQHGPLAIRIPESDKRPSRIHRGTWFYGRAEPAIVAAVQLAPDGRDQIIVSRWQGASNTGVSFYGVSRGKLVLLPFRVKGQRPSEDLTTGGFAAAYTYYRCNLGGPIVGLSFFATGKKTPANGFSLEKWSLGSRGFVLESSRTWYGRQADASAARTGANDPQLDFGGCAVSRP